MEVSLSPSGNCKTVLYFSGGNLPRPYLRDSENWNRENRELLFIHLESL